MAFIVKGMKKGEDDVVEAISPPYELINIPFYFMRYRYYLKDKLWNIGKKREEEGFFQIESGQTDSSANWKTPKLTPFLERNFNLSVNDFERPGHLYIFYEVGKSSTGKDYDEFFLDPAFYASDRKDPWEHYLQVHIPGCDEKEKDSHYNEYTFYLNLHPGNIVWVAFSEVRWSDEYREKIMGNKDALKKRFQKIDVDKYIENCKNIKHEGITSLTRFIKCEYRETETHDEEKELFMDKRKTRYVEYYGYIADPHDPIYIVALDCPTLLMDDLCNAVLDGYNNFEQYIKDISTGVNPEPVFDKEKKTSTKEKCEDQQAYKCLFTSASLLYTILNECKYSDDKKYKDIIKASQEFKFEKLLDIDKRRYIKRELDQLRIYIKEFFSLPLLKCSLLDYYDNIGRRKLEGKRHILFWMNVLSLDPKTIDSHIYPYMGGYSEYEFNIRDFCKKSFFYNNETQKNEYENVDPQKLQYDDILDYKLDITKLLLNSIITEKDLYPLRKEEERLQLFYECGEKEEDLADMVNDKLSLAARLLLNIENMFVYFSMHVSTTHEWQQLKNQANCILDTLKKNDLEFRQNSMTMDDDFNSKVEGVLGRHDAEINEIKAKRSNLDNDPKTKGNKDYHSHESKVRRYEETQLDLAEMKANLQMDEELKELTKSHNHNQTKLNKKYVFSSEVQAVNQQKLRIEFDTLEKNINKKTYDIYTSTAWARTIRAISYAGAIAGLYSAINSDRSNNVEKWANTINVLSGVVQVYSILVAKNEIALDIVTNTKGKIPWSVRLGYLSTLVQVIADFLYGWASLNRRDYRAAALYFTTSVTAMVVLVYSLRGASVAFGTAGEVTIPAPWVAGIAIAISIVTGVLAGYLEQADLETFVKGSVFAKGRRGGLLGLKTNLNLNENEFKTSFQVGNYLYKKRKSFATTEFEGFGITEANLTKFPIMLDVLHSMSGIFKMKLKGMRAEKIGDGEYMQYVRFRLWFSSPEKIFKECTIEYEVRIYPYGINEEIEANKEYLVWDIGGGTPYRQQEPHGVEFRFTVDSYYLKQKADEKGLAPRGISFGYPTMVILARLVSANGVVLPSENKHGACYYGINISLVQPFNYRAWFQMLGEPDGLRNILFNIKDDEDE